MSQDAHYMRWRSIGGTRPCKAEVQKYLHDARMTVVELKKFSAALKIDWIDVKSRTIV